MAPAKYRLYDLMTWLAVIASVSAALAASRTVAGNATAFRARRSMFDVHGGDLTDRGDFPGLRIAHLVYKTQRFVADLEKAAADFHDFAREQFALVGDVLLNRRHPALFGSQIGRREPDARQMTPIRFVEFAHVPHDVHVADLVALPRIDATFVRNRVLDRIHGRLRKG